MTEPTDTPSDPGVDLRDGVPVSNRFDDVYFSREDGLAETAHVFLAGCGLPDAWHTGRRVFTIGETGFGTGLNFLATWDLWRRHRPAGGTLHYLAVEGYPIARAMLAEIHRPFPALAPLARDLVARYPDTTSGLHRIWFTSDRVCLTLAIGEATDMLSAVEARVDAWFLDGFAPAKNPSMWSPDVLRQVARMSAPGARLASFTAAGSVRRGLTAAGFTIDKRPGFGRKRDCIAGRFTDMPRDASSAAWFAPPSPAEPERIAVIGGGVAGAALVGALERRGLEADWIDRHGRPAAEASGNPVGLMMARPTLATDGAGRLSGAAFRHAVETARALGLEFSGDGVLELATGPDDAARFDALAAAGALDAAGAEIVDAASADTIAGLPLGMTALHHARAGWLRPADWVTALGGSRRPRAADVRALRASGPMWTLLDAAGTPLAEADAVIVAAGVAAPGLLAGSHLPLQAVRGQLTRLTATAASRRLRACLAHGGYLSPADAGVHVAGATYDRVEDRPTNWPQEVRPDDHARTLAAMPPAVAALFGTSPGVLGGRAAIRAAAPDRQPVAGPVCAADDLKRIYDHLRTDARSQNGGPAPYLSGLFVLTGLGSRGLVTAPLMAELVVSQMLGEPWPVERDTAEAAHPNRLAIRALRRRRL